MMHPEFLPDDKTERYEPARSIPSPISIHVSASHSQIHAAGGRMGEMLQVGHKYFLLWRLQLHLRYLGVVVNGEERFL